MNRKRKIKLIIKQKPVNKRMTNNNNQSTNINLIEQFDGDKLAYIVNNLDKYEDEIRKKSSHYHGCPLALATNYLNASKQQQIAVSYKQNSFDGRWCSKHSRSLQMMSRPLRHSIADGYWVDVDVHNCHPVALKQKLQRLKLACPVLEEYVDNREKYIAGNNREKMKKTYLSVMNGGLKDYHDNFDVAPDKKHLRMFKDEMETIRLLFTAKYPDLFKQVKQHRQLKGKDYNHEGGLMSVILNEIENKLLMAMYEFFGNPKYAVLCFCLLYTSPSPRDRG